MYDTDVGYAIRASLRQMALGSGPPSESARAELRARVCAAVDELRSAGWPIEKIIVRMKEVAAEVGYSPRLVGREHDALVAEVVRWCIDRYYALSQ
jgi:hypothetical protein